jgi:hypothetical protein
MEAAADRRLDVADHCGMSLESSRFAWGLPMWQASRLQ